MGHLGIHTNLRFKDDVAVRHADTGETLIFFEGQPWDLQVIDAARLHRNETLPAIAGATTVVERHALPFGKF